MKLMDLVQYLNSLLHIDEIKDVSLNGLQIQNSGEIKKTALAVDASLAAIQEASAQNAQILLVHHGLFWKEAVAITGPMYDRIRTCIQNDLALYACHLPLDMHPELGNNAQIDKVLGWPVVGGFGDYHGQIIGTEVRLNQPVKFEDLVSTFRSKLNFDPLAWDFGRKEVQRIGYVSGRASDLLNEAIDKDLDVFVTGESRHEDYWIAKEAGINVIFGGHYATETLGVKAVGAHLKEKFNLETVFLDLPTGL